MHDLCLIAFCQVYAYDAKKERKSLRARTGITAVKHENAVHDAQAASRIAQCRFRSVLGPRILAMSCHAMLVFFVAISCGCDVPVIALTFGKRGGFSINFVLPTMCRLPQLRDNTM